MFSDQFHLNLKKITKSSGLNTNKKVKTPDLILENKRIKNIENKFSWN